MNKFAFLVPYYNHPQNIKELVAALKPHDIPIIIVDDGSDEPSKAVLRELEDVLLLTRPNNDGKGAAMKDGFEFAFEKGFTHAFQIDADFQHDVGMIERFLEASRNFPQSIICSNPIYDENAPRSRVYGRKITNFWVRVNALTTKMKDTMCGFRIYPLETIKEAVQKSKTNRMEFDMEILLNASRQGVDMRWIDIKVRYEKDGVSHFKMLRDNALISLMHAKYFFSLPKFIFLKFFKDKDKLWWQKGERANAFFLELTLFLVRYTPTFILNFIIKIVVFFYYIFSKNERENIKNFRRNLKRFSGREFSTQAFENFYEFGVAICDKFRVWQDKISKDELDKVNAKLIDDELVGAKKGQVIITSHLGNAEICKAISTNVDGFEMVVLVYTKGSENFYEIMNKISLGKIRLLNVNELDVSAMLELKNIVDSGVHIGVMGDRVPINGDKFMSVRFLGKEAKFNYGPYLLAAILGVKVSSLWCEKIDGKFRIELMPIAQNIALSRDKAASVRPYVQKYVKQLEEHCLKAPSQWFNFFDFWR